MKIIVVDVLQKDQLKKWVVADVHEAWRRFGIPFTEEDQNVVEVQVYDNNGQDWTSKLPIPVQKQYEVVYFPQFLPESFLMVDDKLQPTVDVGIFSMTVEWIHQ
jgi:hypothetical protein